MKNKYKATPKTYASQPRRNGKVTASLAGLLARADVHVEEGELKSISTGQESRAPSIYANGGVVGAPRWMDGENQFFPVVDTQVEVIQGHHRYAAVGRLHQIRRFDPPVNVRAGEELILGTGRLFIGNTDDPDNMREIGIARDVRVELAQGQDRTALVEVDFAGLETRVTNFVIQSAVADEIMRNVDREIVNSILLNQRYSSSPNPADAFAAVPVFSIGVEYTSRRKKKKGRKPHPESGKVVVRRKTRRTLLGIVVTDMRVASGGFKRTSQLGYIVENQRRGKNGRK